MDPLEAFRAESAANVERLKHNLELRAESLAWVDRISPHRYAYNFRWMGVPIIQLPQDMVAMQELLFRVRPDMIVETGVAHGGSLVYYASVCQLLGHGRVLGIDIDIRAHNRAAIEEHAMAPRISLLQGSSIDPQVVAEVHRQAKDQRVLVVLDSNHTHEHVLAELEAYAPLVASGSYCVVFDTVIEDMAAGSFPDRPWDRGNNPRTAVREFLAAHPEFEVDEDIEAKLLITVAPGGYLRRR